MMKTFCILAISIIILGLIQPSTCKSLSNSTISSNSTALAGQACKFAADCSQYEDCYNGLCYALKKKLIYFMASLFGGFFGADYFYLSRGTTSFIIYGVVKLITFGGFGFWWLTDLILILAGANNYDGYYLSLAPWDA